MSTTSALFCFDALVKEGKHTCTAHCLHSELVIIPAKFNKAKYTFCTLQITKEGAIPLTTHLVWVSSPKDSGSKVTNDILTLCAVVSSLRHS